MELKRLHRLIRLMISKPCLFFLFSVSTLFTTISSTTTACSDIRCTLTAKADTHFQELGKQSGNYMVGKISVREQRLNTHMSLARRYLSGPGSTPPRCTSKCVRCTPCYPVHLPVPPGTPVTAEYYPEAWRCKCGNRLYMP